MNTRQRGIAIVPALLLATLAVTLVAGLFWRQQVQLRMLENQRLASQAQWVARGALDWAQRQLQEDARRSAVDHLGEAWAAAPTLTRLDNYLDAAPDTDAPAQVSSQIVDAQSFFNLSNLVSERQPRPAEVAALRRLLTALQLDPALAQSVVAALQATQKGTLAPPAGSAPRVLSEADKENMSVADIRAWEEAQAAAAAPPSSAPTAARLLQLDDLLQLPGFSPAIVDKLRGHVIFLPRPTPLNANTADALTLAALLDKDLSVTTQLVAARRQAWFRDEADLALRSGVPADPARLSVRSRYFLVHSQVRVGRADLRLQALIERSDDGQTRISWLRET